MEGKVTGPILTDEQFFCECLNLELEGMEETANLAKNGDYAGARGAFASYIRRSLCPEKFFRIPYERPENAFFLEGESDEDVCERLINHVLVSVGIPMDYGKENPVDWLANPTYNGYPEWTWQLGRHHEFKVLAHEYRRNPKPEYAKAAAELFESWVKQAVFPGDVTGYGTTCWRTIECGIRMGASWPYALFTFYNTEAFTDDVIVDWYKSVWEHGLRLYRNRTHGNWLLMEMNGLAHIGIFYPQLKESQMWLDNAIETLNEELEKQMYPDGLHYELSTNYHEVMINNYQRLIATAKVFEVELPEEMVKKLETACEVDIKLMMPDGTLPDINDGCRTESRKFLELKKPVFPDVPGIDWVISGGREGQEPEYKSVALPYSGFFVMRDGWGKDASWAMFDGAPFGRGHQHEDKLSMTVYAGEKLLITEAGNYAYDDSQMRRYIMSTRAHNTVRVDGLDQNRRVVYRWRDGDIKKKSDLLWNIGQKFDYAESTYDDGYGMPDESIYHNGFFRDYANDSEVVREGEPEVVHNRSVYFVKEAPEGKRPFFIVVDRLSSEHVHEYEMLWHVNSEDAVISESGVDTADINICISVPEKSIQIIKGQEEPEWQGFVSTGSIQGMYEPVNCVSAVVKGDKLRIVTVLYPHVGEENDILSVTAGENPEDNSVEIGFSDGDKVVYYEEEMRNQAWA